MSFSIAASTEIDAENVTLLPQFITDFCSTNPEQVFARVIDLENDDSLDGTRITASHLLTDGLRVADHLRHSTGLSGETAINVSILARSGYDYFVNFIGISLNHWTVRI